jgi:CheY-like chemotaxis protein
MSVISLFSGSFCHEPDVVSRLHSKTESVLITDSEVISEASRLSDLPKDKIERSFTAKTSIFDKFGREKERANIFLKLAVANLLSRDNLLIAGFSGLLIPKKISHVLTVCLIADLKYRISLAAESEGISDKEAIRRINKMDENRVSWILTLFEKQDPWDGSLYDIVLPMDKTSVSDAADLIAENAVKRVVQPTERSKLAAKDFLIEAQVEKILVNAGHFVDVAVESGKGSLTIHRHVLRLKRLKSELQELAGQIQGVKAVHTKVGKGFHKSNIYRQHDFTLPDRVLLVDHEREFVESLSDRLIMCDIGAAVTYDGGTALDLLSKEEPEVMLLDLKMPGIDGFEVLRQVKLTRPEVEVIILTAKGTEAERNKCRELGAFAFLQKPVNMDELNDTLRLAKEKIRQNIARQRQKSKPDPTDMCD